MNLSFLEGWGFISLVIVFGILGYLIAALPKQLYEDRDEPRWLMPLIYIFATAFTCGGVVVAVLAALNHW